MTRLHRMPPPSSVPARRRGSARAPPASAAARARARRRAATGSAATRQRVTAASAAPRCPPARCAAPAPQRKAGDARRLGGKLQPAAGGQRQRLDLADHGGERAAFAAPPPSPTAARDSLWRAGEDQPLRREPVQRQAGRIEIAARQAPQHRPRRLEPRQDAGEEPGALGAFLFCRAEPQHLVQRAPRKAAAGERRVDRLHAERQGGIGRVRPIPPPAALDERQPLPQHAEVRLLGFGHPSLLVLFLF